MSYAYLGVVLYGQKLEKASFTTVPIGILRCVADPLEIVIEVALEGWERIYSWDRVSVMTMVYNLLGWSTN